VKFEFTHSKLRKQPFAENFKILGGTKTPWPPSDAHGLKLGTNRRRDLCFPCFPAVTRTGACRGERTTADTSSRNQSPGPSRGTKPPGGARSNSGSAKCFGKRACAVPSRLGSGRMGKVDETAKAWKCWFRWRNFNNYGGVDKLECTHLCDIIAIYIWSAVKVQHENPPNRLWVGGLYIHD